VARARICDRAVPGALLAEVHARDEGAAEAAVRRVREAFRYAEAPVAAAEATETVG
jgi:hypothetical protein